MNEPKYYTSIVDLPLNKFIDCLVDSNLFALVITGEPDKLDLQSAWDDILLEYNDSMGDNESKLYYRLLKEARLLLINIKDIEINVALLKLSYEKELADELNGLIGQKFPFDISDIEKYYSDLNRCLRISKGLDLKYKLKVSTVEALREKFAKENNTKPTKEYFHNILISLTDHSGVKLNASEITVYEFSERVRRFSEYIKQVENRNKK